MATEQTMTDALERAPSGLLDAFAGKRLFVPISLGNHYYCNEVLTFILRSVAPSCSEATTSAPTTSSCSGKRRSSDLRLF